MTAECEGEMAPNPRDYIDTDRYPIDEIGPARDALVEGLRSALDIVSWMIQHNHVRVMDEYQEDWTDKVAKEGVRGVRVLYPEQLTWPRSCQPCQSPA